MFGVNMKRLLLMVSLLVALGTCLTGVANAQPVRSSQPQAVVKHSRSKAVANCTVAASAPWLDGWGYVNINGFIQNCTPAVDKITFMWDSSHLEGFWDKSECPNCVYGNLHYYGTSAPTIPMTVSLVVPTGVYGVTYKAYGWCSPGAVHNVGAGFWWKIFNASTGTWGSPHDAIIANTAIHCGS